MRLSRRALFAASLGAVQAGLLHRYGLRPAAATARPNTPTKLLAIWVIGGVHWESFFAPFTRAGINHFIPTPAGGLIPWGYLPEQVRNFDGTDADLDAPGPRRKLRGPIYWNPANPADASGTIAAAGGMQNYRPYGYVWSDPRYRLYDRAALLVAADQNTASHQSGIVASLCGVAGANFSAPAVQAVVANAMTRCFPDRPLPSVSLGLLTPTALGLPSIANPTSVTTSDSVEPTLSDRRDGAWLGLRARTPIPDVAFDGTASSDTLPATAVDAATLAAIRSRRGVSSRGTDALLEQLYDTQRGASRIIARDVMSVLERTTGFEHLQADTRYPAHWTACIGAADTCGDGATTGPYDFALRLLKSDLVTSVTMDARSIANFTFDTHFATGPQVGANHLRITMESIGRMVAEMSQTPSRSDPARTLLDETLVYVFSDFGRTFPKVGSDHHPATCALLVGGNITGNQMIGGYNEMAEGSPMGTPVDLIEETGARMTRPPKSQDVAATVLRAFGLQPGRDFFIPGGYGVVDGVVPA